jgi:hypothetical protein
MQGLNPKIKQLTLPLMPATSRELRRLLELRATRTPQLQKILLSDPGAVIAVFRALEKIRPGASEQVADAGHAVSMLGMEPFRRLIEEIPELAAHGSDRMHAATGYSQAAHAAYYAEAICARKAINRVEEISTAALLQNPAMLALWVSDPESALRASNAVREGVAADVAFGAELGEPLEDANRHLAAAWSLPSLVRQSLGDWDDFNPRPQIVRLADEIAQTTSLSWRGEHTCTITSVLADFLDLEQDAACAWLHQRAVDAARHLRAFDYPLPGFELALMPGDHEHDDDDHPVPEFGRRPAPVAKPDPQKEPDLHTTMASVMKRMRINAGTSRIVFAMLNKERSHLRTRLALGGDKQDGIRRLNIDLKEKNLFSALMSKPQSVWLNTANAARYRAYLPDSLRAQLHEDGAFMMSLFVGDRPLGLMYGDGADLDEPGYRRFRELCSEAIDALRGRTPVPA